MTLRIAVEPGGTLGVFDDQAAAWVAQALTDDDAVDLLAAAEPISPHEVGTMIGQLRGRTWPKAYAPYAMSYEEAAWLAATAAGLPAGNRPLEFDRKGERIRKHGITGYSRGCRCDTCLTRQGDITHGLNPAGRPSGYAMGCRCDICRDAKNQYERDLSVRRRRAAEDKQTLRFPVDLSPRIDALIRHQAGQGREASGWIWQAVTEKLERDTDYQRPKLRRPSRARPVVRPAVPIPGDLPEDDERTIPVSVNLTPRAAAVIAEQGGTRGGWIWEAILEKLERDTGYQDSGRRRAPRRPSG